MSCLPLNHAFQQPLRHVRQTIGRQKKYTRRKRKHSGGGERERSDVKFG
jgi:hypothetical protein